MLSFNNMFTRHAAIVLLSAGLVACAAEPENDALIGKVESVSSFEEGTPGGVQAQVATLEATVVAIDYKKRMVTLQDALGNRRTLMVGPEAINFDQVKKGDRVKITMVDELMVYVRAKGEPGKQPEAMAARAPEGQKPKVVAAESAELVAVVKAVDLEKHTATLQFPDGRIQVFPVRDDVKLDKKQVGREVVFRLSQAMALSVEPAAK